MQTKINYVRAEITDFLYRLKDIRFAGQVLFVVIVLLISWSGVKAIQLNYGLQKQIATAKQENSIQQLRDQNLKLENVYYNSKQYLELQARADFGLATSGEQELIVPQSVAMAYAPKIKIQNNEPPKISEPTYQKNIQAWVNFFLHRK
jgi:cell division protein FtsB